jgi:hypothetical protein
MINKMTSQKLIILLGICAMLYSSSYAQTIYPKERKDLNNDLTSDERIILKDAIISYLESSSAIQHHIDNFDNNAHGGNDFLKWHREFVSELEQYLIDIGLSSFVPLPKWSPDSPIPFEFQGFSAVAQPFDYFIEMNYSAAVSVGEASVWDRTFNSAEELKRFCGAENVTVFYLVHSLILDPVLKLFIT